MTDSINITDFGGTAETHRLLTTLLGERQHPSRDLIVRYHERWEQVLADDELQTHQRECPVLHSQTPAGVVQEKYGLLPGHDVIRKRMCDAAELADMAPRERSFVNTLKILRCRLAEAPPAWRDCSAGTKTCLRKSPKCSNHAASESIRESSNTRLATG